MSINLSIFYNNTYIVERSNTYGEDTTAVFVGPNCFVICSNDVQIIDLKDLTNGLNLYLFFKLASYYYF